MRSGGRRFAQVVASGVLVALAASVVAAGPASADRNTERLWAVVREADGHLKVLRGLDAAVARRDAQLGRSQRQVVSVEETSPVHALGDPLRSSQWALDRVPFELTWPSTNGAGITVAVVDTGVAAAHEDLNGAVLAGTDLASDAAQYDPAHNGMVDPAGHGTHVAGIIAAHVNNGRGVAGAAPGVKILPVRVLDAHGGGYSDDVANGIIWAVDHGARVVNLSLGGGDSPGMHAAVQYAVQKNVVVVGAAGNNGQGDNSPSYPAAYSETIAVASVGSTLAHEAYSNTGSYVDLAAPGGDAGNGVVSTYGGARANDYQWMAGTSMATPYVSAAAALVLAKNHSLKPAAVQSLLESTATDLGPPGRDNLYGVGLVNPRAAVSAATPGVNSGTKGNGYWVVTADGRVRTFGHATFYGDLRYNHNHAPIVAGARTSSGHGYWLVARNGAVYAYGDAKYYGGMSGRRLRAGIVGMAATPTGRGYIMLGGDGGIFTFGDAKFYGSTGAMRLNAPVLDMTETPDGHGYWFVAADGGIFSFGDAKFYGSTGAMRLAAPVRSMTASTSGKGYWMVADDGGIFAFNVPFKGSLPGVRASARLPYVSTVRMRALPSNDGYYMLCLDGTVYAFGAAKFFGSASGTWAVDIMQAP
jgi:subtilisin family serine protease